MTANVRMLRRAATGQGRRLKVDWTVPCGPADEMAPCRVLDISSDGARISGPVAVSNDNDVLLHFEHAAVRATIAWRSSDRVGLRFHDRQAWVGDNCAKRFDAAAWLN